MRWKIRMKRKNEVMIVKRKKEKLNYQIRRKMMKSTICQHKTKRKKIISSKIEKLNMKKKVKKKYEEVNLRNFIKNLKDSKVVLD